MFTKKRLMVIAIVVALVLALPVTALANKKFWIARLSTGAELHDVVGSRAFGSASFASAVDGSKINFGLTVVNLSGAPTGAHIHGPASTSENAGILITLCGAGPAPAVMATCTFDADTSTMSISGSITSQLLFQAGLSAQDFISTLDDGLAYVNVHTALNPAGEARGQLAPR